MPCIQVPRFKQVDDHWPFLSPSLQVFFLTLVASPRTPCLPSRQLTHLAHPSDQKLATALQGGGHFQGRFATSEAPKGARGHSCSGRFPSLRCPPPAVSGRRRRRQSADVTGASRGERAEGSDGSGTASWLIMHSFYRLNPEAPSSY